MLFELQNIFLTFTVVTKNNNNLYPLKGIMGVERLEDVKKEVRSVLICSKEGMTLQEFLKTYRSLLGIRFPSRQLGYTSDHELIESMPDVVRMKTDRNGSYVLTAVADETTEHIQKLVQKQKSNKKKPNSHQKHFINNYVPNCVPSNSTQRNRPFVPAKLRGEILQILKNHPDGIGYTTFILEYSKMFAKNINLEWLSSDPSERFRKLVLAIPELEVKTVGNTEKLLISGNKTSDIPEILNVVNKVSPQQSNLLLSISNKRSQERAAISKSSKENFEKVLKHCPEGITAVHFPVLYQKLTGQQFDLYEFGYNSLFEMTDALPEIFVRLPIPESSNDWILFHSDYAPHEDCQSSFVHKSVPEINLNRIPSTLKEHLPSDIALPSLQYISPKIPEEAKTIYVQVFISNNINPSCFWFQLLTPEAKLAIHNLEKEMESFYNYLPNRRYKMADVDIVVGATCAAFYSKDQSWYRARITALPSLDSVVVEFVDYGPSDQVPRSALCYLKYAFIHLPIHAYKAQLAYIKPANEKDKWTRETNKRFEDLCRTVNLMMRIEAEYDSILSVSLCDTSGDDDIFIDKALVKEGYAEFNRNKNICSAHPVLYLNTSESSSSSSTPLQSPALNLAQFNTNANKQQALKYVKRVASSDGYVMHILLVENKAYISVGDLSYLFWNDNSPDMLLTRLKYINVTMPTVTIARDNFPNLFEQCERFSVKDFDETKNSVTLFPLQCTPKVVNILGHPSENVRNILIREIDNFNPDNTEWKEPFEEPEPYMEFIDSGNKYDRLCLHDLKARQEALNYKRKMLLDSLKEKWSNILIDQVRNLDSIQNYITKRIKEVEAICKEFSKCV